MNAAQQNYSITLQDIENYLDSKADDEVVGITCDGGRCLVAEAFRMKYPEINDIIASQCVLAVYPPHATKWKHISIGLDVSDIITAFDHLFPDDEFPEGERAITKREWLEREVCAS